MVGDRVDWFDSDISDGIVISTSNYMVNSMTSTMCSTSDQLSHRKRLQNVTIFPGIWAVRVVSMKVKIAGDDKRRVIGEMTRQEIREVVDEIIDSETV